MNTDNKKLGRGLGSLLSPNKTDEKKFKFINISQIKANKDQPRKNFKKEELKELSTSIKTQGILQPIVVRPLYDSGDYEIIAGERRWRAAQIAGVHEIPCLIKILNNQAVQEAALIENIQRENLNVVEEANAYKNILNEKNIDQDKLSLLIGKSKSHISNLIRLLDLEEDILNFIIEGKISMGHARALIGVPNAIDLANEIIDKKLSVRQVEKNTSGFKKNKKKKNTKDTNILDLEKELSEKIGLKTNIYFNENGSSGSLTLFYSDLDQLDNLMKRLKKN
jgi:ParB family chromosome partitioning protein